MTRVMILALSMAAGSAFAQHVPPDPPQNPLPHQSYEQMVEMMRMDDTERYGRISVDRVMACAASPSSSTRSPRFVSPRSSSARPHSGAAHWISWAMP